MAVFLRLDVVIDSQNFRLINIYAPCDDPQARRQFITALDCHLTGSSVKVLGGDFNFTEDNSLDKQGGNLDRGTDGAAEIRRINHDFNLLDIYRHLHPHQRV